MDEISELFLDMDPPFKRKSILVSALVTENWHSQSFYKSFRLLISQILKSHITFK